MDNLFDLEPGEGRDLLEREERCQKSIRAVSKAILMRLFVSGLLFWTILRSSLNLWVTGMLLLVILISVFGILPLASELKKQRAEWKKLLEEEE